MQKKEREEGTIKKKTKVNNREQIKLTERKDTKNIEKRRSSKREQGPKEGYR